MADVVTSSGLGGYGELGNQMFQVAAVLAYAAKTGKIASLPPWTCKISGRDYTRLFHHSVRQDLLTLRPEGVSGTKMQYMGMKYVELPPVAGDVDLVGY